MYTGLQQSLILWYISPYSTGSLLLWWNKVCQPLCKSVSESLKVGVSMTRPVSFGLVYKLCLLGCCKCVYRLLWACWPLAPQLITSSLSIFKHINCNKSCLYFYFLVYIYIFFYKARRILQQWAAAEYLNTSVPLNKKSIKIQLHFFSVDIYRCNYLSCDILVTDLLLISRSRSFPAVCISALSVRLISIRYCRHPGH